MRTLSILIRTESDFRRWAFIRTFFEFVKDNDFGLRFIIAGQIHTPILHDETKGYVCDVVCDLRRIDGNHIVVMNIPIENCSQMPKCWNVGTSVRHTCTHTHECPGIRVCIPSGIPLMMHPNEISIWGRAYRRISCWASTPSGLLVAGANYTWPILDSAVSSAHLIRSSRYVFGLGCVEI